MALQGIAVTDETADDLLLKLGALFQTKAENWIEVDFSDWTKNNPDQDIFNSIKTAIFKKVLIAFSYFGNSGCYKQRNSLCSRWARIRCESMNHTSSSHFPYRFPRSLRIYCLSCRDFIMRLMVAMDLPVALTSSCCLTVGFAATSFNTASSSSEQSKVSN